MQLWEKKMGLRSVFEGRVYIVGGEDVGLHYIHGKKKVLLGDKKKKSPSCGQDHTACLGRQNGQHIATVHNKLTDSKK